MCVVHVKYCNHLLAMDMAGVACRGFCMRVVGKCQKMGIRKGTVVSFIPTLFGCFLEIPSLYVFSFFKCFFCDCSSSFFWGGGDIKAIDPDTHVCYSGDNNFSVSRDSLWVRHKAHSKYYNRLSRTARAQGCVSV